jgi:hypothetical protein
MHMACGRMSKKMVVHLLKNPGTAKKACVGILDKNKQTPLHQLCLAEMSPDSGDAVFILNHLSREPNFRLNTPDNELRTPLHYAVQTGKVDLVGRLLEMRANPKAQDKDERQPLHLAAMYGQAEIVPILVRAGADVNARDKEHCTPILLVGRNLMQIEDVQRMATGRALVKEDAGLNVGYPDPQGGDKMLGLDQAFRVRLKQPTTPRGDESAEYTVNGTRIHFPSQT